MLNQAWSLQFHHNAMVKRKEKSHGMQTTPGRSGGGLFSSSPEYEEDMDPDHLDPEFEAVEEFGDAAALATANL